MKPASEIVSENSLASSKEHKTRSTSLKRLAGGLASTMQWECWDPKEREILSRAQALLKGAASNFAKASTIKEQSVKDKAALVKTIEISPGNPFLTIQRVEDKIALIGMTSPYQIDTDYKAYDNPYKVNYLLGESYQQVLNFIYEELARRWLATSTTPTQEEISQELAKLYSKYLEKRDGMLSKFHKVIFDVKDYLDKHPG